MDDQKPWPGFALYQDFAEERGLKPIVKKSENAEIGKCVKQTRLSET